MTKEEIAMQITLKAIECGAIKISQTPPQAGKTVQEVLSSQTDFNVDLISNFYSKIFKTVSGQQSSECEG